MPDSIAASRDGYGRLLVYCGCGFSFGACVYMCAGGHVAGECSRLMFVIPIRDKESLREMLLRRIGRHGW